MNVAELRKFLDGVPDTYELDIKDVNFPGGLNETITVEDFKLDAKAGKLLLPAVGQDYVD